MPTVQMKTRGALDSGSILSLNRTDRQCVKSRETLRVGAASMDRRPRPESIPVPERQGSRPAQGNQKPPVLRNGIQKGQKATLPVAPADILEACFGWNTTDGRCDIDVSAFLLGMDGKVLGDSWFVFYGQTLSPDKSTEFIAEGGAEREKMKIDLGKLDARVQRIVFVLTINEAIEKGLHFGMVKDGYVRIRKQAGSGEDLVSFLMTEYYSNVISMMIGELYRHNGGWKFNAVGNGVSKDLAGLCERYGVAVD